LYILITFNDHQTYLVLGTGGEWKSKMSESMVKEFDEWIKKNTVDVAMNPWQEN